MSGVKYFYTYNLDGTLHTQSSSLGQFIGYSYDTAGHIAAISDTGLSAGTTRYAVALPTGVVNDLSTTINLTHTDVKDATAARTTTFSYDAAGRVSREKVTENGADYQNTATTYDQLNRIATLTDLRYTTQYEYDAAGNRTHIAATYYDHTKALQTQELWYAYDSMNRVKISQGVITSTNTVNISDSQGTLLTYDAAGHRVSATTYGNQLIRKIEQTVEVAGQIATNYSEFYALGTGRYTESYHYDGLGRLTTTYRDGQTETHYVSIDTGDALLDTQPLDQPLMVSHRYYDNASREIKEVYQGTLGNSINALAEYTRTSSVDNDGRVLSQATSTSSNGAITQLKSTVNYSYDAASRLLSYDTK
jgi:YD repeat-containing protein